MILTFGAPIVAAGVEVPCPALEVGSWVEGVAEPQPERLVVYDGVSITTRAEETGGGEAIAAIVVDGDGVPGVQVRFFFDTVWDAVLVDSFEDSLCADVVPDEALGDVTRFFLGTGGSLLRLNRTSQDDGAFVQARLRPNVVAPAGVSARCLFRSVFIAVEGNTGGLLLFTPVVDGEPVTAEAIAFAVPSDGSTRKVKRFELPLGRVQSTNRQGLVGTWFTFILEALDPFGCGRLSVSGWELEHVVLREFLPGQVFTGEAVQSPTEISVSRWFVGGVGAGMRRGGTGTDDDGTAIAIRMQSNDVAPAGVGGEALFQDLYLSFYRQNTLDWTFDLTPIVDGVELPAVEVTLEGVADPVAEVVKVTLAQQGAVSYHPRGAWFAARLTAADAPDAEVAMAGFDLEYEVLTESVEATTNA